MMKKEAGRNEENKYGGLQGFPRRDGKHYRSMVVMVMVMVLLCYCLFFCVR